MNQVEQKLKKLQSIRLSDEARTRMRAELSSYADMHAVQDLPGTGRHAVRSPFSATMRRYSMRAYAALAAFVVIVGGLGGTAYASEGSLPGEALYSVKTHVAEPIQTAFIPSAKGKAAWHAILAERRLEEAAQLAAQDRLSDTSQKEIAANLEEHVEASTKNADRLERSGDTTGSLEAQSDLEARLTAHEQILGVMANHFASTTPNSANQTETSVQNLLAIVERYKDSVMDSRLALEHTLTGSSEVTSAKTKGSASVAESDSHNTVAINVNENENTAVHQEAFAQNTTFSAPMAAPTAAEGKIDETNTVRAKEVSSILARNATLLAKFMPIATSTATSTASSTATTSTSTTVVATSTINVTTSSSEEGSVDVSKFLNKIFLNGK